MSFSDDMQRARQFVEEQINNGNCVKDDQADSFVISMSFDAKEL